MKIVIQEDDGFGVPRIYDDGICDGEEWNVRWRDGNERCVDVCDDVLFLAMVFEYNHMR